MKSKRNTNGACIIILISCGLEYYKSIFKTNPVDIKVTYIQYGTITLKSDGITTDNNFILTTNDSNF